MTGLSQRFEALGRDAQAPVPAIEPGTRDDYLALEQHHYRPGHPMTMMRILTIRDRRPTTADRYLSQRATPRPIAVLIESLGIQESLISFPHEYHWGSVVDHDSN